MDALLTVKEAAEITRLKTKTLYAYAERKIIPHIKLGSRLLKLIKPPPLGVVVDYQNMILQHNG